MLGSLLCIAAVVRRMRKKGVRRSCPDAGSNSTGNNHRRQPLLLPKILIQSDEEKQEDAKECAGIYLPEEREEKDGMIRSFLTGQMVPAEQADRRPIAIMMSNDKEARPQYGINRAGVVYEAPVEGGHEPLYGSDRGL